MSYRPPLHNLFNSPDSVLLETLNNREETQSIFFHSPNEIIQTNSHREIPESFARIDAALKKGCYVAGYITYECGLAFEEIPVAAQSSLPLIWFGVYETKNDIDCTVIPDIEEPFEVSDVRFTLTGSGAEAGIEEYSRQINRIKEHIREGDVYQINYTGRMLFTWKGSPAALYGSLKKKQKAGYAAYLQTSHQTILSLSPELFFKKKGNHIIVKPMKGTMKRGRTPAEDRIFQDRLIVDIKNRAENIMIVDVLRNDLGKISEIGSVKTTALTEVEQYDTLFQMTSTVEATLKEGITTIALFQALFPSGSITGAPKRKAMQILSELESTERGVYTGAIGYFSPNTDAVFNVAIRTLVLGPGEKEANRVPQEKLLPAISIACQGVMGAGGGIVWDSDPEDELRECKLKARFLTEPYREFQLIETMRWKQGCELLDFHLERLEESSEYFGFQFNREHILESLRKSTVALETEKSYKVRLLLQRNGSVEITSTILNSEHSKIKKVTLASVPTDTSDRFLYHKTTLREIYNRELILARNSGYEDALFLNERGEVTEGAINNIIIKKGTSYQTPPIESGVLNGVFRRHLMNTHPDIKECVLFKDDLIQAEQLFICNAVRGLQEVILIVDSER